jgi:dihydropteroate synthase
MFLRCGHHSLDLSRPIVMGVLNVTPDSFSDGGRFSNLDRAVERAQEMAAEGAGLVDVGGESTRPGAAPVAAEEEIRRVAPVIEALVRRLSVPVSVDTSKPDVMIAAVHAGAGMINDVRALQEPGALEAAARSNAAICLMHMQGEPRTMQKAPQYDDVVAEVREFLRERIDACVGAGVSRDRLVIDPGIGFGKRLEHNMALLAALPAFNDLRAPMLVGASRKSLFRDLLARPVNERLAGGLAVATAAVLAGVSIIRVHDVRETVDAVKVATALRDAGYNLEK